MTNAYWLNNQAIKYSILAIRIERKQDSGALSTHEQILYQQLQKRKIYQKRK